MKNVKIQNVNGSPSVIIDGKVYPPMMMTIATTDIESGKLVLDREYFQRLGESGIKIFFPITDTEWGRPGALKEFTELAEFILDAVPDAYLIVRIGCTRLINGLKIIPTNASLTTTGLSLQ